MTKKITKPMPRLHVKIREDQKAFIKARCKVEKKSEAEIVREILDLHIAKKTK